MKYRYPSQKKCQNVIPNTQNILEPTPTKDNIKEEWDSSKRIVKSS
jgi:hypothetical protein